MNKRERELLESQLTAEEKELRKLKIIYSKALSDIDDNVAKLLGRADADLQHVIYQIEYQKALKKQISGILDDMNSKRFESITQYMSECYENGFIGTMYDIHGQDIPLIMPIDQEKVIKAMKTDSKISKGLYARLGEDADQLKKRIANNLSRGIASNMSYAEIARNIRGDSNVSYNNAARIARTEGHRVHMTAAYEAQIEAKKKGAKVVKQWDSSLDKHVRDSHRRVDGEFREVEEKFSNGLMFPSDPNGEAAEVINCRCTLFQRAKWGLDEEELETLKERAAYYELDKTESFNDFKKKYLKAAEESLNDTDVGAILNYMSALSYVVNDKLRNANELTPDDERFIMELDKALDKMPVYNGHLQRSLYFSSDEAVQEFVQGYTIGSTVVYKEYISTTKGAEYNSEGQVQIFIQNAKNGKDITEYNSKEAEVLYKRGATFEVVNVVEQDGKYYILLVEKG